MPLTCLCLISICVWNTITCSVRVLQSFNIHILGVYLIQWVKAVLPMTFPSKSTGYQGKCSWKEVDHTRKPDHFAEQAARQTSRSLFSPALVFHHETLFTRSQASSLLLPDPLTHYREMNSNGLTRSCLFYLPTDWQVTTKFSDGIPSYKVYCIPGTIPPLAAFPRGQRVRYTALLASTALKVHIFPPH